MSSLIFLLQVFTKGQSREYAGSIELTSSLEIRDRLIN